MLILYLDFDDDLAHGGGIAGGDAGSVGVAGEEDGKLALGNGDGVHGAVVEADVALGAGEDLLGHLLQHTEVHALGAEEDALDVDVLFLRILSIDLYAFF